MVGVNRKVGIYARKRFKKRIFAKSLTITRIAGKSFLPWFLGICSAYFSVVSAQELEGTDGPHFGLLYDRFSLTLREGTRTETLGPIFGHETHGTSSLFSFSPIFSFYRDSSVEQTEAEIAYPIIAFDKFGSEYRFHLFQVISFAGGKSLQDNQKKRTTIFPFYFRQESENPAENYTAVVPFYGHLQNRLFRNRIFFVMLPLYLQTEKRGVVTDNYVFPLFHRRHGPGLTGWQFWPLIGHEKKEVTVSTNTWGDQVVSGGHEKFMALWPLYFNNTLNIGTTNVKKEFILLPFYSSSVSSNRVSKWYGLPFGYTHTIDREKKYEERDMPWPLIVFAHGEGKTTRRVFPFFSQAKTPTLQSDFYLWPLWKYNRITASPLDRERTRILFFLYSDLIERNTVSQTALRRRDFWPLYTWRKDHQNNERLQVLSILEPLIPGNKSIERVYSPVWSIYRQEKNGTNGNQSRSLLWNLYRSERRGETRRTSALFGLFQREKKPEGTKWRVFFIPFRSGRAEQVSSEADSSPSGG
jgi:hypothetical protein